MKIFKFMTLALVAMLGFSSCSEDCDHDFIEVDYSKDLVGTWTCLEAENDYAEALTFNADGSVTSTGVFDGEYWEKKGTFKIKDNKMTLTYEDGDYLETRFEMVEGEVFSLVDDYLDVRYNYYYCENDLADEVVGMWVWVDSNNGNGTDNMAIQTYKEDGTAIFTAFYEGEGYTVNNESTYRVIGDLLIQHVPNNNPSYMVRKLTYNANGTSLGNILTAYHPASNQTISWLHVKQGLNLTGKTYDYSSAYVTNAKGTDEDFTIMGNTFNMAKIEAGDFDVMFRSELFCVELNANSFKYKLRLDNGQNTGFDTPMIVDGNKVTLDMSAINPALKKVEMYMYQDADDSQLHIYMHTDAFINYFANMEVYTLILEGKIDPTDAAAIEKVYTDMEARIESINVSFVMKARN